jgi:hypothetical protein
LHVDKSNENTAAVLDPAAVAVHAAEMRAKEESKQDENGSNDFVR